MKAHFGRLKENKKSTYKLVQLLPCPSAERGESRIVVVPFGLPVPEINCQLKILRKSTHEDAHTFNERYRTVSAKPS